MIVPRLLQVRKWATWDSADVRLDVPGITMVRGRNDDEVGNENFVGKSSLFNSMYALNHGQHQLASRKNSVGKLVGERTRIREVIDVDRRRVVADMRGSRLKVSIDGNPIDSHRRGDERVGLLSEMGTTAELWAATIQVNGVQANPLVRGTSSARCQFLERAFSLNRWDGRHKRMGDVLASMRRASSDLTAAREELKSLGEAVDVDAERDRLESLEARRRKARGLLDEAQRVLGRIEDLPPRPAADAATLRAEIARLERRVERVAAIAADLARWEDDRGRRDGLEVELSDLLKEPRVRKPGDLDGAVERLTRSLATWGPRASRVGAVEGWRKIAVAIARDHDIGWSTIPELHALSLGWAKNWREGQTECPVCGGAMRRPVDAEQLTDLTVALTFFREAFDPSEMPDVPKLRERLEELEGLKRSLAEQEGRDGAIARLREKIAALPAPRPTPPSPGNPRQMRERLTAAREELKAADIWEHAGRYAGVDVRRLRGSIGRAAAVEEDLAERIRDAEARIGRAEEQRNRRESLAARVAALERECELQPVYRALQQAYSPNGMRLWLLEDLLTSLVAGLNANSHETRYRRTYGYKLTRNRDLTLTASGPRGAYDLYLLSGAEGSLFVLNFLAVLLPMLPDSRRCSMLILDEVDANCSPRSRDLIADVYLPRLARIVDTMFVITPFPRSSFDVRGARELLVVKKNETSTLHGA